MRHQIRASIPHRWRPNRQRFVFGAFVLLLLGIAIVTFGIWSRQAADAALKEDMAALSIRRVRVTRPTPAPAYSDLVLPGTVQALIEVPIYARTNGYLKSWTSDIGAKVKKGQILAEIDTPEIDDQLRQADADLGTAEANERLARITMKRWDQLVATGAVSRQAADEKQADAAAKAAMVASFRANRARLLQQQRFKHVLSPFDGIVTARRTEVGMLINAGSASGTELFRVADASRLRIFVQVPESSIAGLTPGLVATLRFSEFRGQAFEASVIRMSGSIDPVSRTELVELQTDNARGMLLPGGYAEVGFRLPSAPGAILIPVNTLLFRPDGVQIALIGTDERIHLRNVSLGLDLGNMIEIRSGLGASDRIVVNPPDSITEGDLVKPAAGETGSETRR